MCMLPVPENLKREQENGRGLEETGRDPAADCLQGGNTHGAAACLVKCKPTCGATAAAQEAQAQAEAAAEQEAQAVHGAR